MFIDDNPRLQLIVEGDRNPVPSGEMVTYSLTYSNRSIVSSPTPTLRFRVPEGAEFVSADTGGNEIDGVVTWLLPTLNPGELGRREVTVLITVDNGSAVMAEGEIRDLADPEGLARASAVTNILGGNSLNLSLAAFPDPATPGEPIVFELTVMNAGVFQLSGVEARLRVPEEVNGIGLVSTPLGDCPGPYCESGEFLTWDLGNLSASETRILSATVEVSGGNSTPPDGTMIRAIADVGSGEDQYFATASAMIRIGTITENIELSYNYDLCPPPTGDGVIDACDLILLLEEIAQENVEQDILIGIASEWMKGAGLR